MLESSSERQPIAQRSTVLYTGEEDPFREHQLLPDKAVPRKLSSSVFMPPCMEILIYITTIQIHHFSPN